MLAGLLAVAGVALPAQAADPAYPKELVNGSFDYLPEGGWDTISPIPMGSSPVTGGGGKYTSVDPANGQYIHNAGATKPGTLDPVSSWESWPGFDKTKFGWESDQTGGKPQGGLIDHARAVELQRDSATGNTYAEIVASETDKAILQRIDTQHATPTVYTVSLKHASLSREHADTMRVLVNDQPVRMTRVGSNLAGDPDGWTGTDLTSHATNDDRYHHDGQWTLYRGTVTIPANTPVSTFTFQALNALDPTKGNLIDDVSFQIGYPLMYDANGGVGMLPKQTD